jgi:hypothetical protein
MTDATASPLERLYLVHGRAYRVRLDFGAEFQQTRWDRPLEAFMLNDRGGIPVRFVAQVAAEPVDALAPIWVNAGMLAYAGVSSARVDHAPGERPHAEA